MTVVGAELMAGVMVDVVLYDCVTAMGAELMAGVMVGVVVYV